MPRRPCVICGSPCSGSRCTAHPATPRRSAHARGYGADHARQTARAIEAEPWCHTPAGCPYPDAGTASNPLTGGHPLPLADFGFDVIAWGQQPRVPQCRRCNSGKRERNTAF